MLFRKLRLDWRYAIGELVIVVAGVLIALAADGWSGRQQDRVLELRYLHGLEAIEAAISSMGNS